MRRSHNNIDAPYSGRYMDEQRPYDSEHRYWYGCCYRRICHTGTGHSNNNIYIAIGLFHDHDIYSAAYSGSYHGNIGIVPVTDGYAEQFHSWWYLVERHHVSGYDRCCYRSVDRDRHRHINNNLYIGSGLYHYSSCNGERYTICHHGYSFCVCGSDNNAEQCDPDGRMEQLDPCGGHSIGYR